MDSALQPEKVTRDWNHQTHPSNSHYVKGCRCVGCKCAHTLSMRAWRAGKLKEPRRERRAVRSVPSPSAALLKREPLQCGLCTCRYMDTVEAAVVHMRVMHGVEIEAKDFAELAKQTLG